MGDPRRRLAVAAMGLARTARPLRVATRADAAPLEGMDADRKAALAREVIQLLRDVFGAGDATPQELLAMLDASADTLAAALRKPPAPEDGTPEDLAAAPVEPAAARAEPPVDPAELRRAVDVERAHLEAVARASGRTPPEGGWHAAALRAVTERLTRQGRRLR